ncbi:MAG: hypothetical protein MHPSP_002634, partial [Paramarteilia canceri]
YNYKSRYPDNKMSQKICENPKMKNKFCLIYNFINLDGKSTVKKMNKKDFIKSYNFFLNQCDNFKRNKFSSC